jgi:hypothetical protein
VGTSEPLSRRVLLVGAAVTGAGATLIGCGPPAVQRTGDSAASSGGSDVRLVEAAIADEHAVLEVCLAALAGRRSLRRVLAPLVAEQRAQISALRAALTDPGRRPTSRVKPLRGSDPEALRRVRSALLRAQRSRRSDALSAESGSLARLLASVSASHAVAAERPRLRR